MYKIGIDLGTTNSLIGYWDQDKATLIPNSFGDYLTPSIVSVDENDNIVVGKVAKERLISHPERTVSIFKRHMGSERRWNLGKYEFRPEELSAIIIKSLIADAKKYFKIDYIEEAIISVPAYFNDRQRRATKQAAELAGLKVERLINEPTAAAIAYGLHQSENECKFMVLDLGGGTFDVSILELFEGVMEVHSTAGDNFLGGEDFTECLAKRALEDSGVDLGTLSTGEYFKAMKAAEQIKLKLSGSKEEYLDLQLESREISQRISQGYFEECNQHLLNAVAAPIERAMRDAKLKPSDLDNIVLVGGATNMPCFRNLVTRMFGRFPETGINPDQVVCVGATIQAALKSQDKALEEIILTDICPYSLGTEYATTLDSGREERGLFKPIIQRNTVIPTSQVIRLYSRFDNQKSVRVGVYQGESRLTHNNILLGSLSVEIPKNKAGEESIDIRFTYDKNCILEVIVTVTSTKEESRIVIVNSNESFSEDDIEKSIELLEHLKINPYAEPENQLLLARAERMYEEYIHYRDDISGLIYSFQDALNSNNRERIKLVRDKSNHELNLIENDRLL